MIRDLGRTLATYAAVSAIAVVGPLVVAVTPKAGLWVRGNRPLVLAIGRPIPTDGLGRGDREMLTERTHIAVAELLALGNARLEEPNHHV